MSIISYKHEAGTGSRIINFIVLSNSSHLKDLPEKIIVTLCDTGSLLENNI